MKWWVGPNLVTIPHSDTKSDMVSKQAKMANDYTFDYTLGMVSGSVYAVYFEKSTIPTILSKTSRLQVCIIYSI